MNVFELDPSTEYIKIHGLQRSGTNYVSHLINENFENTKVLVNTGGWKHGFYMAPWVLGKEVHVVVVVKNPYAWLVSVYDYWTTRRLNVGPDLRGVPFTDFVRNRIYFEKQRDVPYLFRASNPVQHWNDMCFHWTSILFNEKKLYVVEYNSLLGNKNYLLEDIGKHLGIKLKDQKVDCDNIILPSDEEIHVGDKKWDKKEYYTKEKYLELFDQSTLDFVNQQLDLDLMIAFGYEYKGV